MMLVALQTLLDSSFQKKENHTLFFNHTSKSINQWIMHVTKIQTEKYLKRGIKIPLHYYHFLIILLPSQLTFNNNWDGMIPHLVLKITCVCVYKIVLSILKTDTGMMYSLFSFYDWMNFNLCGHFFIKRVNRVFWT